MTNDQLDAITQYLKENVWRNPDLMFGHSAYETDLVDIISSLHNLLYEAVTGKRYDYAFHWCNKVGAWTEDNIFDDIMKEENNHDHNRRPD